MMETTEQLLDQLNGPQRDAVLEFGKPLLVLAGAGSGKTRVITTKIAYAIQELHVPSWNILAVTFTNKAASEMQERVLKMVEGIPDGGSSTIKTFHGFGAMMLRRFHEKAGLSSSFAIYDDGDSYDLLHRACPDIDPKIARGFARKISLCKDRGLTWQMMGNNPDKVFVDAFKRYQDALDSTGNVDFADLIIKASALLDDGEVASWAHRRYSMILVDEYQDTNKSQFEFLKKLKGPDAFVCVVGDDDQSIYRFRGAEVGNIKSFVQCYPTTRVIKLEQNYRSTPSILNLANSVIVLNHKGGDMKKLWTDNPEGKKPELWLVEDEKAEASLVAQKIKELGDYDHTAVLFRTNAQSGMFENAFIDPRLRIPYKVVGALKFYEREQVKDGLAMMYLLCNPRDVVSFSRMINKPPRSIGSVAREAIDQSIEDADGNCLKGLETAPLSGKAKDSAQRFLDLLSESHALLEEGKMDKALQKLFRDSGLVAYYAEQDRKDGKEEGDSTLRAVDFDTLLNQATEYGDDMNALSGYLEQLALDPTTIGTIDPRNKPGVTLITMHNTKGLEFDNVFVVGMEDGLFPSQRSLEEDPSCQEERRIFYVAVTRAKKNLILTSAKRRRWYGTLSETVPSRFLGEIGKGLVTIRKQHEPETGYHGMGAMGERRMHRPSTGDGTSPRSSLLHKGFGAKTTFYQVDRHEEAKGKSYFSVGERVYSDKYGTGTIQKVKKDGPEVIIVHFDSGKDATFLSQYAKLERIAD